MIDRPTNRQPHARTCKFAAPVSRRQFLRNSGVLTAGVALIGPLIACSTPIDDTLSKAQQQGFIRVGFANESPYGHVTEDGTLTGVGPELARIVFRELGIPEIDGVLTPFGSLIERLQLDAFDVIAAGMFITPDRCKQVIFTEPYFCIEQAFLVERGNPRRIRTYADIANDPSLTLGVVTGAVEVEQAVDAGIPETQIVRVDSPTDLLANLQTGLIDAGALSTVSLASLAEASALNGFEVTEPFAYRDQLGCGAFAFRHDDTRLRDEFNQILSRLRNNGSASRVLEPFGFSDALAAAEGVTNHELCQG